MSIHDDLALVAVELMKEFAVPAKLVRTSETYDAFTDTSASSDELVSCRAVLAPRKIKTDDGILTTQTMAVMNKKPEGGDRLRMGCSEYIVGLVEEIAPTGKAIIWMAVVTQ